jgi:hypothetical protein
MKRVLLALIPVALLATASLAFTHVIDSPYFTTTVTTSEDSTRTSSPAAAAPRVPSSVAVESKTITAQAPTQQPAPSEQTTQPAVVAEEDQIEPLPELVVDKTPLTSAMIDLDKAIQQAKLSVTALDAASQSRYIQETLNLLAGREEPNFRLTAQSDPNGTTYRGVSPLLVEARVKREAAEVQWIAAVQAQLEARSKKLAELAQAGQPEGTVPQPATPTLDLSATVGPTGVLGTRGMRPEEQANDLIARAVKQAIEALKFSTPVRGQNVSDGDVQSSYASDDATRVMESLVRTLETAKKIVQIAIDR